MANGDRPDDPALTDRAWVGYHPRAMAPGAMLLAFASVLVWAGHWYFDDISELADWLGFWARFGLAWAVWPAFAGVFLYRTVTFTYRVTDQSVLVDFGPLYQPVSPVWFKDVTSVVVGGWMVRWFGVGWVELEAAGRAVRLTGLRRPVLFAERIRQAVSAQRSG